jgi:hypothetical protein
MIKEEVFMDNSASVHPFVDAFWYSKLIEAKADEVRSVYGVIDKIPYVIQALHYTGFKTLLKVVNTHDASICVTSFSAPIEDLQLIEDKLTVLEHRLFTTYKVYQLNEKPGLKLITRINCDAGFRLTHSGKAAFPVCLDAQSNSVVWIDRQDAVLTFKPAATKKCLRIVASLNQIVALFKGDEHYSVSCFDLSGTLKRSFDIGSNIPIDMLVDDRFVTISYRQNDLNVYDLNSPPEQDSFEPCKSLKYFITPHNFWPGNEFQRSLQGAYDQPRRKLVKFQMGTLITCASDLRIRLYDLYNNSINLVEYTNASSIVSFEYDTKLFAIVVRPRPDEIQIWDLKFHLNAKLISTIKAVCSIKEIKLIQGILFAKLRDGSTQLWCSHK